MTRLMIPVLLLLVACPEVDTDTDTDITWTDTDTDTDTLPGPTCPVQDVPLDHYCMAWCPAVPDVEECAAGWDHGQSGYDVGRLHCIGAREPDPMRYIGVRPDGWTEAYDDGFVEGYVSAYWLGYTDEGCER